MKLAVGFLTYNEVSARYLKDFWPSLLQALEAWGGEGIILIGDNSEAADNPNAAFFSDQLGRFEYKWNGANLGFAKAYNHLLSRAKELKVEYFLAINPDTILDQTSIKELVRALDNDSNLAAVSPKVLNWVGDKIDTLGIILKPGLRFADYGQGQADQGEIPAIIGPSGAAGLFRLSALEIVKTKGQYFDERMFMYKEDCDLAYRLYQAGFSVKLVREALIRHDRTAKIGSAGLKGLVKNRRDKSRLVRLWSFQNQRLIWRKYWFQESWENKILISILYLLSSVWALFFERFLFNNSKK